MPRRPPRLPQPPIDRARRAMERHPVALGLAVAVLGAASLVAGVLTDREIDLGIPMLLPEWRIVESAARGGLPLPVVTVMDPLPATAPSIYTPPPDPSQEKKDPNFCAT